MWPLKTEIYPLMFLAIPSMPKVESTTRAMEQFGFTAFRSVVPLCMGVAVYYRRDRTLHNVRIHSPDQKRAGLNLSARRAASPPSSLVASP